MDKKALRKLQEAVKEKNLKYTKQREMVFEAIYNNAKHLNAEETYNEIKDKYPDSGIGIATVYKSLVSLEEMNLISSISINDKGAKKYEANFGPHHDHLICTECEMIIEFYDEEIEKRQDLVAKQHNFIPIDHSMYLYGLCAECQKKLPKVEQ